MDIWGNGHFGTDEHWGKWALGANGHLGGMGTSKNEHQSKWALGANGHCGANGHFGTDGHWGKWALGEMGTRKNEHQGKWVLGIRSKTIRCGRFDANELYAVDLTQRQFDARTN